MGLWNWNRTYVEVQLIPGGSDKWPCEYCGTGNVMGRYTCVSCGAPARRPCTDDLIPLPAGTSRVEILRSTSG